METGGYKGRPANERTDEGTFVDAPVRSIYRWGSRGAPELLTLLYLFIAADDRGNASSSRSNISC